MNKTENPRKSLLKLIYNGVDAAAEFSSKTESFTYTDVASGEADTLSLTVNNQDGRWLNRSEERRVGKECSCGGSWGGGGGG